MHPYAAIVVLPYTRVRRGVEARLVGVITAVRDTSFLIRSADKTILEIARSAVAGVDSEEEEKK